MLQQQHPQDHLGRSTGATMCATAWPAFFQSLIDGDQQGFVLQQHIGLPHPVLPQLLHGLLVEALAEAALLLAEINHGCASEAMEVQFYGAAMSVG
jgi:hypothetical protein